LRGGAKARLLGWPTQPMATATLRMGQVTDTTSHNHIMVLDLTTAVDLPMAGQSHNTPQTTMMPVLSSTIIMMRMVGLTGLMGGV